MAGRSALPQLVAVGLLVGAGCTAITGIDDFSVVGDVAADGGLVSPSPEGGVTTPPDAASPPLADAGIDAADSSIQEGGAPPDASCSVPELDATKPFAAVHLQAPLVIDGDVSDWPCGFVALDPTSAQRTDGTPLSTAHIAVGWDATGMYFACRVFDPDVESGGTEPYQNDACELFFGQTVTTDGTYVPGDNHFVVDYENLGRSYPTFSSATMLPASVKKGAAVVSDGFVIEMFIPNAVLGFAPAANGTAVFDAQLDDCQHAVAQVGILFSYAEPTPDISVCLSQALHQPACDTRMWGQLVFEP